MGIILTCIFIFAILIVALSFYDLRLSIAFYISYLILVPYLEFKIAGLTLSYNLVNTILLVVFIYQFRVKLKYTIDFQILRPFLFLFGSLFLLTFFAYHTPWSFQFNALRLVVMKTCILTLLIWNYGMRDSSILNYIKYSLFISFIIAGLYGLYLMNLGGINPYTSTLALYFGANDAADIYANAAESRLSFSTAGKIQATMSHPMSWGLHLSFMICLVLIVFSKERKTILLFFVFFLAFSLLVSGVRTGIAALVIAFIYYLILNRQLKLIFYAFLISVFFYTAINSNSDLSNLFASFTDIKGNKSDVKGSSITLRLEQLQGALNEIQEVKMFGKGYSWTSYYQSIHGDHPILLAFESLIFVVLCNSGIIGIILYAIFFIMVFKLHRKFLNVREDIYLMDGFVVIYIGYAIGTGEYGYMQVFSLYYVFLLCYIVN